MALLNFHDRAPMPGPLPGSIDNETTPFQPGREFFYPEAEDIATKVQELTGIVAGTKSKEVEITLEAPANPKDIVDPTPVLIFHGLMGVESEYDGLRNEIAKRGLVAVTSKPVRGEGLLARASLKNVWHPARLAARAALGMARAVQEETGTKKIDGLAHSNGLQTGLELGIHAPWLMRSLTAAGGVGTWEHNFLEMPAHLKDFAINDFLPSLPKRVVNLEFIKEELEYTIGGGEITLAEIYSAGACSTKARLEKAKELGILLGGMFFKLDDFIPFYKVERDSQHHFHDFHRYLDPFARHTAPQDDPSGVAEAYVQQKGRLLMIGSSKNPSPGLPLAA